MSSLEKVKHMSSSWKIKYPKRNIYIMRDHNWAFSAWEIARLNKTIMTNARLLHVDFHDDYFDPDLDIEIIETKKQAINVGESLSINNFIKASIQTGTIKDVYTIGDYTKPSSEVIHSYTYHHFEDEHRLEFFSSENQSFILDIDLDFFNLHAHSCIGSCNLGNNPFKYSDEFIKQQLNLYKNYEDEWDLITVCISPMHCGGGDTAQKILNIFLETFDLKDEYYEYW